MMKNYILYTLDGIKIKKQRIKISDIYPFTYAYNKLPDTAETLGTIYENSTDTMYSTWHKHASFNQNDTELWEKKQKEWENSWDISNIDREKMDNDRELVLNA